MEPQSTSSQESLLEQITRTSDEKDILRSARTSFSLGIFCESEDSHYRGIVLPVYCIGNGRFDISRYQDLGTRLAQKLSSQILIAFEVEESKPGYKCREIFTTDREVIDVIRGSFPDYDPESNCL